MPLDSKTPYFKMNKLISRIYMLANTTKLIFYFNIIKKSNLIKLLYQRHISNQFIYHLRKQIVDQGAKTSN